MGDVVMRIRGWMVERRRGIERTKETAMANGSGDACYSIGILRVKEIPLRHWTRPIV